MTTYVADGTTIGRKTVDSPLTYTTIAQVTSIGSVGSNRGLIDVTNLSSSAREYKKAIKDGQELNLVIQYDMNNTQHEALRSDVDSESAVSFRITLPDSPATKITFDAQVLNWTLSNVEIDNVILLNVTLKPTGALVFT